VRTYLTCPFDEKDQAKALGARWDAAKKRWYIEDPKDLAPFARWLPEGGSPAATPGRVDTGKPVRTGPKEVVDCGCDALPWEPCVHTRPSP
jgi:hypothetical protein